MRLALAALLFGGTPGAIQLINLDVAADPGSAMGSPVGAERPIAGLQLLYEIPIGQLHRS